MEHPVYCAGAFWHYSFLSTHSTSRNMANVSALWSGDKNIECRRIRQDRNYVAAPRANRRCCCSFTWKLSL